jgi:hypothetical protein
MRANKHWFIPLPQALSRTAENSQETQVADLGASSLGVSCPAPKPGAAIRRASKSPMALVVSLSRRSIVKGRASIPDLDDHILVWSVP